MYIPDDIIQCITRGYERADEELPKLSLYGFAMAHLHHEPEEWNEKVIHVSDYRHVLDPDDGACERQLWHRLRGDERKETTLWERVMWDQGFAMQLRFSWLIANGLPRGWVLHEIEMDITEGLPGDDVGSCDLVLALYEDGLQEPVDVVGIEIKTQRGRSFQYGDFPKPGHRLQAMGEGYALQRIFPQSEVRQFILYCDREGQNSPLAYRVDLTPDSLSEVEAASTYVNSIAKALKPADLPPTLRPQIKVRENKGPNSIYLKEPWMCSYCNFKGTSCPGALDDDLTELGIVAKGDHQTEFEMYNDVSIEKENRIRNAIRTAVRHDNVQLT